MFTALSPLSARGGRGLPCMPVAFGRPLLCMPTTGGLPSARRACTQATGRPPTVCPALAQLKIVTWANEEVASDALSIHGYERYTAPDYALSAWYPPRRGARPPDQAPAAAGPPGRPAGVTKWWADGDEPLYYIVSSKARSGVPSSLSCCTLHGFRHTMLATFIALVHPPLAERMARHLVSHWLA